MTAHPTPPTGEREALPLAPSLGPTLEREEVGRERPTLSGRTAYLCLLTGLLGVVAALVARGLTALIGLFTNLAFYHRISFEFVEPSGHELGFAVILVPVVGGVIVGLMARYGSAAIRGHGIPEAMEHVLFKQSRIPARMTLLKPLSAAIAIGTGGPFGAEGPIIATGGSLGSLLGQLLRTTASERKVLLAAGAAGGMSATFGTPVAAVLLAVELLLFELRPRSVIPVSVAAAVAAGLRAVWAGGDAVFAMPTVSAAGVPAIAGYFVLGLVLGLAAVGVTRLVYSIEDAFERLPIHWMWWPAIGGVAVGVVGYVAPLTLGVGYTNIERIVSGEMAMGALALLCIMKLVSWSISLGSGTSGGTLAPLFIIGGGLGALLASALNAMVPGLDMDVRVAGLVGMAAIFAGASRAFLASVVFAFEATQQPAALVPLLAACAASYLTSLLLMRHSIMTEKIARRGVRVPSEYASDFLEQCRVGDFLTAEVVAIPAAWTIAEARAWLSTGAMATRHQGFPVTGAGGELVGVVTRRDLHEAEASDERQTVGERISRPPVTIQAGQSLRAAADRMVLEKIGRLVVVEEGHRDRIVGMLTRSDLLRAHDLRLREDQAAERHIDPRRWTVGETRRT